VHVCVFIDHHSKLIAALEDLMAEHGLVRAPRLRGTYAHFDLDTSVLPSFGEQEQTPWRRRTLLRVPGRLSRSGRGRRLRLPPGSPLLPKRE
jgi:hypothetical protein